MPRQWSLVSLCTYRPLYKCFALLCEGLGGRKATSPMMNKQRKPAGDVSAHLSAAPLPPPQTSKPTAAAESSPGVRKKHLKQHQPAAANDDDDDDALPAPPSATNVPVIRVAQSSPGQPPPPPLPSSNKPGGHRDRRPSDSSLVPPSPSALQPRTPSFDNLTTARSTGDISSLPTRSGLQAPPALPPNRPRGPSDSGTLSAAKPPNAPPPPPPRKTPTLTTTGTIGRSSKTSAARGRVNGSPVPPPPSRPPPISRPTAALTNGMDSNNTGYSSGPSPNVSCIH